MVETKFSIQLLNHPINANRAEWFDSFVWFESIWNQLGKFPDLFFFFFSQNIKILQGIQYFFKFFLFWFFFYVLFAARYISLNIKKFRFFLLFFEWSIAKYGLLSCILCGYFWHAILFTFSTNRQLILDSMIIMVFAMLHSS